MSDRESDGGLDLPALEARWPILLAVICIMTLTALRPPEIRVAAPWVLPAVELIFLVALVVAHPARTGPRARSLRIVSIVVVSVVVLDTLAATVRLINVLVNGGQATNSAQELLAVGGLIWVSNVIAFSLLYWLLDSGGAAVRAERGASTPDLAFPQHMNPELAPRDWRPMFVDYFYLGLTASTAFSPTDVMPLARWTKLAMGAQSLISLAVLGLVVARAVNVLT